MKRFCAIFATLSLAITLLTVTVSASGWTPSAVVDDRGLVEIYVPFADAKIVILAGYTENGQYVESRICRYLYLGEGKVYIGDASENIDYWQMFMLDESFCPVWKCYWSRTLSAPQKAEE